MPCKHAELALIYAQQMAEMDEPWKLWEYDAGHGWDKCVRHPLWDVNHDYRQIHKTIQIGNFDVPEPMRTAPTRLTPYWYVASGPDKGFIETYWTDDSDDINRLKRGQCHLTLENCIIHAKALFSFSEVR